MAAGPRDQGSPAPPPLGGVLETCLYYEDDAATEHFYRDVLGMRPIGKDPGRHLFFRAGESVFLLFRADVCLTAENVPPHGARGPGHCCFRVPAESYEAWRRHMAAAGVPVIKEIAWPGGRSFYFHDPDGNVLEIAEADIWPR